MLKRIWNIASIVFVLMTVVIALLLAGVRLIGLKPFVVTSGSMTPAYPVGALIYVKQTAPENVRIGDAITFYMSDGSVVATHRVVAVDKQAQCFQTKGDANDAPDGMPVSFARIIGVPVFSIPLLGYLSSFISFPPGSYIAVFTALIILLTAIVPGLMTKSAKSSELTDDKESRNDNMSGSIKAGSRAKGKRKAKEAL